MDMVFDMEFIQIITIKLLESNVKTYHYSSQANSLK